MALLTETASPAPAAIRAGVLGVTAIVIDRCGTTLAGGRPSFQGCREVPPYRLDPGEPRSVTRRMTISF